MKELLTKATSIVDIYPTITVKKAYEDKNYQAILDEWLNHTVQGPPLHEKQEYFMTCVYNFFRYSVVDENKCDNFVMNHEALEFKNLISGFPKNPKRDVTLITGSTQSGKTFCIISILCIHLAMRNIPVYIVKDIKQKNQLVSRYIEITKDLRKFLKDKDCPEELISYFDGFVYYDARNKDKKYTELFRSLNHSKPKLVIGICHYQHLERVELCLESYSRIVLIIDEAHKTGAYSFFTKNGYGDDLHDEDVMYEKQLAILKENAYKSFLITSTPQTILLTEPHLYAQGIIILPESNAYTGIHDWYFGKIPSNEKTTIYSTSMGNLEILDSFISLVYKLSKEKPMNRVNKFGIRDKHPINVLAKIEYKNDNQKMLMDFFKQNNVPINKKHKTIIKAKWTILVFNQEGVRLYSPYLQGTIQIGKESVKKKNGEYLFKDAEIGQVWQYLAENGGVEVFSHIMTIAYKSAEEGITFCSTWSGNVETDYNWHLSHLYIKLSPNICSENLEQAMGRANGNHGDDLSPLVYTTIDDKKKLIYSHDNRKEQLEYITTLAREKGDVCVKDYIENFPLFSNRVSANSYSIKGAIKKINKISNPNSDIEDITMRKIHKASTVLQVINPDKYEGKEAIEKIKKKYVDVVREGVELSRIEMSEMEKRFAKWKNEKSKIATFMREGVKNKIYTKSEFNDLCKKYTIDSSHLFTEKYNNNSKGYGKIFKRDKNRVYIYPELSAIFNKYFYLE